MTLPYALAAARRGWHVFPLTPGEKVPLKGWKWTEDHTTDPELISSFWRQEPYNIGIACGPSRLVVLDLDTPKAGQTPPRPGINHGADSLAALCEEAGENLPSETFQVRTGRGGTHLYFSTPEELGNSSGRLGWLIDTRGSGGYVVAPGSVVNGSRYEVAHRSSPAPLPSWLTARLTQAVPEPATRTTVREVLASLGQGSTGYALAALRNEIQNVLDAMPGTRNHTLNTAAFALGQLVGSGLLPQQLVDHALTAAALSIGLSPREAAATIRSGLTAGARAPRRGNA